MSALPQWKVEAETSEDPSEATFDERRKTRTQEIQCRLLELEDEGLMNGALVGKALRIIRLPVERFNDAYKAQDALLEKLLRRELEVGDFIERWYQLDEDSVRQRGPVRPPGPESALPQPVETQPVESQPVEARRGKTQPVEARRGKTQPVEPLLAERSPLLQSLAARSSSRRVLVAVLVAVFVMNFLQTGLEEWIKRAWGDSTFAIWMLQRGEAFTRASHEIEGRLSFGAHDLTRMDTVYGYSVAYFFVFPAICLAVATAFYRRPDISPFRVLTLSVAVDYAISLPFFLFFPVVERWTYAESDAIMLSDLVSARLINFLRPISGLDNCFPSFHVSMTVILILLSYRFHLRGRPVVLGLGTLVILSTFVLGIHWLTDMVAGVAVAVLSVVAARALDRRFGGAEGAAGRKPWTRSLSRWPRQLFHRPSTRGIFVSYRRDDSPHIAARIGDFLKQRYGEEGVSMDVADIAPGDDWRCWIRDSVRNSGVAFVVIGPGWLTAEDKAGNRRLDSGEDFVRYEIESAFEQGVRVVPLLVDDAELPAADQLPPSLRRLTERQAVVVGNDPQFRSDMQQLVESLDETQWKSSGGVGRRSPA